MPALEISNLSKRYGDFVAVDRVSLTVEAGEFISLLGPSGCGKTTILRMVAGLIDPDEGAIRIDGTDVTWQAVNKRNIGLVFQSYALFPHMSVFENVAFGLRQRKVAQSQIDERVGEALDLVRLTGLNHRFPRELSGGQQQRVALARAIAPRPALLLLDEPLSNLDAKLRDTMRIELRLLQRRLGISTVFVTHDQEEALTMSDAVCVLHAGQVQQIGTPQQVYNHPGTAFVAQFFGRSNTVNGRVVGLGETATIELESGDPIAVASLAPEAVVDDTVRLTLRWESLQLSRAPLPDTPNSFRGTLRLSSFAGNSLIHVVELDHGFELTAEVQASRGVETPEPGSTVWLSIDPSDIIAMKI